MSEQQQETVTPPSDFKNRPRTTVIETLVYHRPGENPTTVSNRFASHGESIEQEYKRQVKVGPDWSLLDTGWLKENVSMLVVVNDILRPSRRLSPKEEEFFQSKAIELAVFVEKGEPKKTRTMFSEPSEIIVSPFALLLPGESMRFRPVDVDTIMVRCLNDVTKLTVHCYPK